MLDDNYLSLMEEQPVSQVVQQQPNIAMGTINQYVITKTNDYNNIDLQTLKTNQQITIFTQTPYTEWLTFQFQRKEKLLKIIALLYCNGLRTYSIECQYLDSKQQWVPNFYYNFQGQLMQNISPPVAAYGIRFRGRNNIDESLQFINLNILAKAQNPYVLGQISWEKVYYMHNKYEIVNIMNQQPFYKKFNNLVVSYKGAVVTKKFDLSTYDIEEITDNQNQDIHAYCQYPNWLTFEFYKKFKLSKIEIQLYIKDRRKYDYELEIMDKQKTWKNVVTDKTGYKPIELGFNYFFPSYGVRIRGKSNVNALLNLVSIKIFAQRGRPIEIQNI